MKKLGRPTDNPKTYGTRVRMSQEDKDKLAYCHEKTGLNNSEIIRLGIDKVYEELKKEHD